MSKDQINLPKTVFSMKANLPAKEPNLVKYWDEIKLYDTLRQKAKGREKFILHDGPPYANGNIHMGTALNKILKDIIVKFHQMDGKDSVYVPGWDCHGLPIEWKIEEQYKKNKKNKNDVPVVEFRKECRTFAEKWIEVHKDQFTRLGVVGDWENYYSTMSYDAEAQIVRELGKFLKEGSLYRGFKPVLWSTVEKTALADAEVEYQDHKSDTIYACFPIKSSKIKELKDQIKVYRNDLRDDEEIASNYAKNIVKIARRIEFASIYPPNALDKMQSAIIKFDNAQKDAQGGLRYIDIFLFPAGTIVASGPSCSEQGSGRWLPKPSDTFNKFILMSKPSVGYKDIPLLWVKMVDVSKIIGFILPDWIADILPGEYPVHTKDGIVKQNFKGGVLKVVTGDFKLFKIPVPYGHIWDSFLRVFLGLIFGILIGVPLGLFMGLNRFAKGFFDPLIELYRPVPPLAWAPLIISVLGIDNTGKVFLLFMVSLSIMIISARAGASGTQLSKIHAAHSLGASKKQILRYVIFPNSLPEILTGIRVAVGMCWGTLVAAEFLAGTTGIGFVENVAKKYFQYEVIWITIFIMGMLGLLFDITLRKIIDKTIPWRGKG